MKIINQFRRLQEESKVALRYRKYQTEVFCGKGSLDYGIEIIVSSGKYIKKEYDKFVLSTEERGADKAVIIRSLVVNEDELEVFAYLIEYVLFELGKKVQASPSDIKKYIEDWLYFSNGNSPVIAVELQIGLIGELFWKKQPTIFTLLIKELI